MLSIFSKRLDAASAAASRSAAPAETPKPEGPPDDGDPGARNTPAAAPAADADASGGVECDLHFRTNCAECAAWAARDAAHAADADADAWMAAALASVHERRKGAAADDAETRRRVYEDDLIVIDPRAKAKELKDGRRKGFREATTQREWDKRREMDRELDRVVKAKG